MIRNKREPPVEGQPSKALVPERPSALSPPSEAVLRAQARTLYAMTVGPLDAELEAMHQAHRQRRTQMLWDALNGLLAVLNIGVLVLVVWVLVVRFASL